MTTPDEHAISIERVPASARDVEMEIVEGEVLLYDPQYTCAVYLNATAALIWGLCDGKRSIAEIIRLIGESYPDAGDPTREVIAALSELRESGVLVIR
jgi:hypothetical protein